MPDRTVDPLLVPLTPHFPELVRAKGSEMLRSGWLAVTTNTPGRFECRVGLRTGFVVALAAQPGGLSINCECPSFRGGRRCAHVWAALLSARTHGALPGLLAGSQPAVAAALPVVSWRQRLEAVRGQQAADRDPFPPQVVEDGEEIVYLLDRSAWDEGNLTIQWGLRRRTRSGRLTDLRSVSFAPGRVDWAPDPADRLALTALSGFSAPDARAGHRAVPALVTFMPTVARLVLPALCATGRLFFKGADGKPLQWDPGRAFHLELRAEPDSDGLMITTWLVRDSERLRLPPVRPLAQLMVLDDKIIQLASRAQVPWIRQFATDDTVRLPRTDLARFLDAAGALASCPAIALSEEAGLDQAPGTPRPHLEIRLERGRPLAEARLVGRLSFDYEGVRIPWDSKVQVAAAKTGERVLRRDAAAESQLVVVLTELGGQKRPGMRGWAIPRTVFPELTSELLRRGWSLEVPGKLYRPWVRATPAIRSGTDWFSLEGPVEFDGLTVPLPELLRALKAREQMVPLGDGTFGVLPEEWLERLSMLSQLAEVTAGDLRFQRSQASLLASLLPDAASTADDGFQKARAALAGFDRVRAVSAAPGFTGELRPYQCEGLGWLQFLEEFGFGGCLADDMGLGKTVQVLAFLHDRWRRAGPGGAGAALIVVPRSLLANWRDEAARFTPELSLLIHAGTNRGTSPEDLQKNALVITTYGTLRRDVELIAAASFSYVILDEAQAIKNAETGAAKAARAIGAPHRLALTGTPIENHLLEIGSMMEFLNPGFLGRKALLERLREDATDRTLAATLRTALAPFILRRTKASVERQLPSRTEQTILCELDVDQRRRYDDLARHYRALLLERAKGMDRGAERMLTLEALLRLRQAACHPALLDPALAQESSAKLEALLPILAEVVSAGHKALVFSQFTTLLALVRGRLDEEKLSYEYLDGKTVDRAERVARFQEDAGIGIFLISLKAGGMGLNLTAADYVFIMDPWWNPAVEAQAIDRAHRIGQTRPVCAYRLIAAGTVEERILALAANKQELADILLATEAGPLERLSREDLERLLG